MNNLLLTLAGSFLCTEPTKDEGINTHSRGKMHIIMTYTKIKLIKKHLLINNYLTITTPATIADFHSEDRWSRVCLTSSVCLSAFI